MTTLAAWQAAGQRFTHRGHSIFYRAGGHGHGRGGPALLLIHGFPTASWDWAPLWPSLCARFASVIAVDMIGFGFSAKPRDYPYSIFDQADLHEALLRALGIAQVHLLAHDYGDTVAQELLARHEDRQARGDASLRVRSCVFLNGGLFPESHRPRLIQKLLRSPLGGFVARLSSRRTFGRQFAAVFGPRTQPSAAELDDFWTLIATHGGERLSHRLLHYIPERRLHCARWVGVLQTTAVPLRVIDGAADPVSGAHMVRRYRELVPNPDTVLLAGIGHYPQIEAPSAVLTAFESFHDRRVGDPAPADEVPS